MFETREKSHLFLIDETFFCSNLYRSNFIRQNEVNEANELLKVQQPHLESSSEMDKLRCITNTAHSPVTITTVMGTNFFSSILSDREYQLTEH